MLLGVFGWWGLICIRFQMAWVVTVSLTLQTSSEPAPNPPKTQPYRDKAWKKPSCVTMLGRNKQKQIPTTTKNEEAKNARTHAAFLELGPPHRSNRIGQIPARKVEGKRREIAEHKPEAKKSTKHSRKP